MREGAPFVWTGSWKAPSCGGRARGRARRGSTSPPRRPRIPVGPRSVQVTHLELVPGRRPGLQAPLVFDPAVESERRASLLRRPLSRGVGWRLAWPPGSAASDPRAARGVSQGPDSGLPSAGREHCGREGRGGPGGLATFLSLRPTRPVCPEEPVAEGSPWTALAGVPLLAARVPLSAERTRWPWGLPSWPWRFGEDGAGRGCPAPLPGDVLWPRAGKQLLCWAGPVLTTGRRWLWPPGSGKGRLGPSFWTRAASV